jgi:tRNASer (uridine44-2'-O)-methyltransferase
MLLWADTFPPPPPASSAPDDDRPWLSWPRPSSFLDFGYSSLHARRSSCFISSTCRCGNGLLTHILISEGYIGWGIDVRARTSWGHYPPSTQAALHVHTFHPSQLKQPSPSSQHPPHSPEHEPEPETVQTPELPLAEGTFIIANHADELTPWVPLISTLHNASGYISIPCCAWDLDGKFERSQRETTKWGFPLIDPSTAGLGREASSYAAYRVWNASLSEWCGWEVEYDTLRIPSTRNWALVGACFSRLLLASPSRRAEGRKRTENEEQGRRNTCEILERVRARGMFVPRKAEGKAGRDH